MYKPGPDLFMADWLSRHNHSKNKEITDTHVALLQIRSKPLEPGQLSPTTLLINHPI